MVVEDTPIKEDGLLIVSEYHRVYNNPIDLAYYRDPSIQSTYHYRYVFWHEGFKFVMGSFTEGKVDSIVEYTTTFNAVSKLDMSGKEISLKSLISVFLDKCNKIKLPMAEVVKRRTIENLEIELWRINCLVG